MNCEVCGTELDLLEEDEGICRNCQSILSSMIDNEIDEMVTS